MTGTVPGNSCPFDGGGAFDDFAEFGVGDVGVTPVDVATDHAGLGFVAGVVGAIEGEVA